MSVGRRVPADAFAAVRARWLPLVAIIGLILLMIASAVGRGVLGVDAATDELMGALLYVPLLGWAGYVALRHHIDLRAFFQRPRIGRYWFVVLGMTVALFVFSLGASSLTSLLVPDYVASAEVSTDAGAGILAISLVVLPPLVEELIFRGFLLERWSVKWRLGVAIVVQAIAFGVLHVDPVGAGMFGVVMALMYIRCGTLWVPIVMHAINNGTVLLAVLGGADGGGDSAASSPAETAIVGIVALAVSAPFVGWFVWRNWPDTRTTTPYERFEYGPGALPPRHAGSVTIVAGPFGLAGRSGRLWLDERQVMIIGDRRGRVLLTSAAYPSITHLAVTPDWRTVVLTATDGTAVTLEVRRRSARMREGVVTALDDRLRGWAP
ncbi:MAG: type II CAAX endopeptidase family protein [Candidatus Nanopelagicales bacterium]